jgi:uncharacterized membrane protein YccC
MSSLVVSQESLDATNHSIAARVMGTIAGATIAVGVGEAATPLGIHAAAQIALAVGLCALFAKGRPSMRVSLWTCPVVLLTVMPGSSVEQAGGLRACEVILGALTGGLSHWIEYALLVRSPSGAARR